ncbi:hypothetical protein WN72_38300 [Bradyrhizobium arachidis]|uniref:Uncharacterized protein n=1 Tax=Bradyrhizobium arachidis TaxID=858423 RepID=A0AAE7TJL5_9BRAD|nr:hypothetical protein WN72_38300 [Bradyrhizobium arachidis]
MGHVVLPSRSSFRGATKSRARNPFLHQLCRSIDSGFALRAPRNDSNQCVNSFIAFSSPSIVIGYMRLAKMRLMMVVDSE